MDIKMEHTGGAQRFFKEHDAEIKQAKKQLQSEAKATAKAPKRKLECPDNSSSNKQQKVFDLTSSDAENENPNENRAYDNSGPVFDDCDEIRRKIASYTQLTPGMSMAKYCREIGITAAAVNRYLGRKGFAEGAGTNVYPLSYHYFERLRIRNQEPKSAHRLRNEKEHPHGLPTEAFPTSVWCLQGEMPDAEEIKQSWYNSVLWEKNKSPAEKLRALEKASTPEEAEEKEEASNTSSFEEFAMTKEP